MSAFQNSELFLSSHPCRIDGKGRVPLPLPFRNAVAARQSGGIFLFVSLTENTIEGVTAERMADMSAALDQYDPMSDERAALERAIFGNAAQLQYDGDGRCSLPRALLERVGITSELVFVGRGETFQIWEPGALAQKDAELRDKLKTGQIKMPLIPSRPR
ncbi:MAG TPA: division/cell wall cluster transcriptional repressor MraZ [Alphaproteobacteria bacterium]|nr:division/cell wall cluster transcriptional repressor MraZ [Alphaproteobacteria bacterium]